MSRRRHLTTSATGGEYVKLSNDFKGDVKGMHRKCNRIVSGAKAHAFLPERSLHTIAVRNDGRQRCVRVRLRYGTAEKVRGVRLRCGTVVVVEKIQGGRLRRGIWVVRLWCGTMGDSWVGRGTGEGSLWGTLRQDGVDVGGRGGVDRRERGLSEAPWLSWEVLGMSVVVA